MPKKNLSSRNEHINATIECLERKGKLIFIEDLCGAKCMIFIILSSLLNTCMSRYCYFCFTGRKLRLKPARSTYITVMRCSANLNRLFDCKPIFLLCCLYIPGIMLNTVRSGSFLVDVGFAISAA